MQKKNNKTPNRKRHCYFCVNNVPEVHYEEVEILRRFVSSYLKIAPRRRSGLCAWHQRKSANAIKQARIAGLMSFVPK